MAGPIYVAPDTPRDTKKRPPPKPTTGNKTPPKKPGGDPASSAEKRANARADAAEARANARQDSQRLKAAQRYEAAAKNLNYQIDALKKALSTEFARGRDQNLKDLDLALGEQIRQLQEGHTKRGADFTSSGKDAEKATSTASEGGYRNLVRERQESMSAILEQGAGETDAMRSMLMGARNWHANASEANQTYFDTMASINQGITDLNIDTKTAMSNAFRTAEGEREKLWTEYYGRRGEAFTQIGNIYGQQADYMEQAKEMGLKMGAAQNKMLNDAKAGMKSNFASSATESGLSYTQKPLPDSVKNFTGLQQIERRQSNTNLAAAPRIEKAERAEGASLRKWAS